MSEREIIKSLVRRYVVNQAGEKEMEVFFYMLKEGKLDHELMQYMTEEMIGHLKSEEQPVYWLPAKKKKWRWGIAASVLVMLGAGMLFYVNHPDSDRNGQKSQYTYIATGSKEVKTIKLSDGTVIWLNAFSKLKFPKRFQDTKRELFLIEGEAYFNVKRDEKRPFVVHAAGTATQVLGTEFNIRSYSYLPSVQVTVSKGLVSVADEKKSDPVMLLPNQRASFDRKNKITFQDKVNAGHTVAWKQGRLIFDNETLTDVALVLEQKFNVNIELEKTMINQVHLTAEFEATDSLTDMLDAISLANNLRYSMLDGVIKFEFKK